MANEPPATWVLDEFWDRAIRHDGLDPDAPMALGVDETADGTTVVVVQWLADGTWIIV